MLKCFSCMKRSLDISDTLKQSLSLAEDWLTHQSPLDRGCPDLRKFEAPKNRFAITITFGGGPVQIDHSLFKKNRVNLTWYFVLVYPEMVLSKTICMSSYDLHVLVLVSGKNLPYLHTPKGISAHGFLDVSTVQC